MYDYIGASGNRNNIKIEGNYSLRAHVLPAEERQIITEHFSSEYRVKTLAPIEIYGSKINALLSRAAARDLYDARDMFFKLHFEKNQPSAKDPVGSHDIVIVYSSHCEAVAKIERT